MSQTNTTNLEDCWLYASFLTKDGYGLFSYRLNGRWTSTTAHKAMFEEVNGKVPDNTTLDHLCKIRSCVNPDHLEAVTQSENTLRRYYPRKCPHCNKVLSKIQTS